MLTDAAIRNAKPQARPYRLPDAGGLYLWITAESKIWRYRFRIGGKESTVSLGAYPEISLTAARRDHAKAKTLVKAGRNPSVQRKVEIAEAIAKDASTFKACAAHWLTEKRKTATAYYCDLLNKLIDRDLNPKFGNLPMYEIRVAHVRSAINAIKERGAPQIARIARMIVYGVFVDAASRGVGPDLNPAASLRGAIKQESVKHATALNKSDFAELLKKITGYRNRVVVIGLKLLAHTLVRTGELRRATWEQIDLDGSEWRIPAENMKKRRPHIVPLTMQTLALLRELQEITGRTNGLLFPHRNDETRSCGIQTFNEALRRLGYQGRFSCHGFRATGATMLTEMNFGPDVVERILAHVETNQTRASYVHHEFLAERRVALNVWSEHLEKLESGEPAVVVPIRARRI